LTSLFLLNSSLAKRNVSSRVLGSEIRRVPRTMLRHRESALPLCRNCNWFWSASLYSNFESLSKTHMVEGNGAVQPTWTLLSLRGKCASNACSRQEEHRALHLQRPQKSVAVEMWKLQARDEIEAAGRSGAEIDSWRAAQKSRVDAFSLPVAVINISQSFKGREPCPPRR
jgi:hypothetical protein